MDPPPHSGERIWRSPVTRGLYLAAPGGIPVVNQGEKTGGSSCGDCATLDLLDAGIDAFGGVVGEDLFGLRVGGDEPAPSDGDLASAEFAEDGVAGGVGGLVDVIRVVGCGAEGFGDLVVVDEEVVPPFDFLGVGGFACSGWAGDEVDAGAGGAPCFVFVFGDAGVVAVGAGGAEVVGVVPGAAGGDGDDVVDGGALGGAFGSADLAEVVVAFEDGFADFLPGAGVLGFRHGVVFLWITMRGGCYMGL